MINAFPPKSSISRTYIPRIIMTGEKLDFKKQFRFPFDTYGQAHDNRNITNQIIDQTHGVICLGPTGNIQGSYAFLTLCTRSKITRSQFIELTTPQRVTRSDIFMAVHESNRRAWCLRTDMGGITYVRWGRP